MLLPYVMQLREKGINTNVSQLKQYLLKKFVNEGLMRNLSLGSNFYLAGVARYYFNGDLEKPYSTVYNFKGVFDGNGHTIANFYQNTWEIKGDYDGTYYKDAMGLFGYVVNGEVANLRVDGFSSDGEFTPTGVIAAYAENSKFINISIVVSVIRTSTLRLINS